MAPPQTSPAGLALLAAGATYVAMAVLAFAGGAVAALFPCSGKLCGLGQAIGGGMFGASLGLVAAAALGYWLGLRWWFVPTLLAVAGAGLAVAVWAGEPTWAWLLMAAAPAIAAVVSSGLRARAVLLGLAVVVALIAGLSAVAGLQDQQRRDAVRQGRIDDFRATPVTLHAPTSIDDVTVRLLSAEEGRVSYDLRREHHDGWLRVVLEPGESCSWASADDLGDGVVALSPDRRRFCRDVDGGKVDLWPDGASSDWTYDEIAEVAHALTPADAQWLVERAA